MNSHFEGIFGRRVCKFLCLFLAIYMVTGGYVRGGIVEDVIDKVTSRTESSYVWILAFLGVSLLGLWAYLILQSKPIIATCLLIILLPFTRRGGDFIYIAAWETSDGYQEKISLTTFMLVLFFFVLFFRRRRKGLPGKFSSTGFLLLVCMAFGVTGMQFLHHDIFSAFWLSCSSVWQYVALAYIISGSVESFSDIRKIVWSLCIVILEAIIIRVAIFHQFFNVGGIGGAVYGQADADYARIGSIAFGGIYYSGYLVTIIYLALYLFRSASSNYTRLFCAAIIGLFFCDLVGTFTRGAWLGTFFIFLLVFWKRQRMFGLIILGSVAVTIAVFWPVLEPMVTARLTLSVSDFNDGSAMTRFMLWNDNIIRFVHDPSALFFGYGIGLAPLTAGAYEQNTYYSTHNLLLEMTSSCGILAPLLLLCLFGYAFINLFKLSRVAALKKESELAVYLFLALLTWFWFANTTSLDVLFYVPFEATILFYTIVFISLRLLDISIKPHVPRAARPHSNGENELIQNSVAHSRP